MEQQDIQIIGRYRIDQKIGQGSMGFVFLAWDTMIRRKVAIKLLRMERMKTEDERKLARHLFLQEARIMGNLNHSHITSVYDMGIYEDAPYMVMEYIAGRNIRSIIDKGIEFSVKEKTTILSMVARALYYAHQRGVLHRDVKPANIMIRQRQIPKITDFGIARIMKEAASGRPDSGEHDEGGIFGTPHHMSPEQIKGEELDHRSDIFSLGILAYEWLSGKKPFQGKFLKDLLENVLELPPPPFSEDADVDKELETIVNKALEKEPDERYQSAAEFSDAIEMYIHVKERARKDKKKVVFDWLKVVERLKKNYMFFSDFTNKELLALFKLCNKEKYERGDFIIREGTSGTKMYIILAGAVAIMKEEDGKQMELETLNDGSCFGEMSIIDMMPRSASVVAKEPTSAIAINETVLRHSSPKLCLKLYRNLANMISEKLRHSNARYFDLLANVESQEQAE